MKLSVSIPVDDVRFLDDYVREQGLDSSPCAGRNRTRAGARPVTDSDMSAWVTRSP